MKEAFGGIINIVFVSVFLLIIIGTLGLVVSYTKAFKAKNIIISTIEQYDGYGCGYDENRMRTTNNDEQLACMSKINKELDKLGFYPNPVSCSNPYNSDDNKRYCYVYEYSDVKNNKKKHIMSIETTVDVHFPIVSNILGFSVFRISGDTRVLSDRN